jgi:hypothetical protein
VAIEDGMDGAPGGNARYCYPLTVTDYASRFLSMRLLVGLPATQRPA